MKHEIRSIYNNMERGLPVLCNVYSTAVSKNNFISLINRQK